MKKNHLFELVIEYFLSLGISDRNGLENFFSEYNFEIGVIKRLSNVNTIRENRPLSSKSHQSHIHVTGNSMSIFYDLSIISHTRKSTDFEKRKIELSKLNIDSLLHILNNSNKLDNFESFTHTKIGARKKQANQVQISKITDDDNNFIQLRKGLFHNDIMIFLKFRNNEKLFVIGIPDNYYSAYLNKKKSVDKNFEEEIDDAITFHYPYKVFVSDKVDDISVDATYVSDVEKSEPSVTTNIPKNKSSKTEKSGISATRDPRVGKEAIKEHNYKCEISPDHSTFESRNGNQYTEAHHLIAISNEDDFIYSLDVKANIISLCPVCHAKMHHGLLEDVIPMIEKLYNERKIDLDKCGISITLDKLISYYKN